MDEVTFKLLIVKKILSAPTADNVIDFNAVQMDTMEDLDIDQFHAEKERLSRRFHGKIKNRCVRYLFNDVHDFLSHNKHQNVSDDQMRRLKELMLFFLSQCNTPKGQGQGQDEISQPYNDQCIDLLLQLLETLLKSEKKAECEVWVKEHLQRLQSLRTTETANSLLHLAIAFHDGLPSELLVKLLVEECKLDVNVKNNSRQTPLHWLSDSFLHLFNGQPTPQIFNTAELVIHNGAHMDAVDRYGKIASEPFSARHPPWSFNFNLKCLAARAVLQYGVVYEGVAPTDVKNFIDTHKAGSDEEEME